MSRRFNRLSFSWLWVLFIVFIFPTTSAFGQNSVNSTRSGEVTDPSGAAVANAQVTFTNNRTQATRHTSTDTTGQYRLQALSPGDYTLTIEAPGFALYQQALIITTAQNSALNAKLTLETSAMSVNVRADTASLREIPNLGKTGTMLEDLPMSVQVIGRQLADAQSALDVKDIVRDSSGINIGGSDGFGADDRFEIRGLDALIYNDGFSDSISDERNGITHSLNGVERVEVLEGPGSALFGSGPPGGTVNIVHYVPSRTATYGASFQAGSFGLLSGNAYLTGPVSKALAYRVDGMGLHDDGFRSLESWDYELRPELSWTLGQHALGFIADSRLLKGTPDTAGLIYLNGSPITSVSRETKYSSPFAAANTTMARTILSDLWQPSHSLIINNRFFYLYRNLFILRNGDGGTITGTFFSGRQLRMQRDVANDFDFQSEPLWNFHTGPVRHALLTGFEAHHIGLDTNRATADLQNVPNIFTPVVPETSTMGLVFLRDAKHSGDVDDLTANYFGLYATDQIDLTSKLKLRIGGREDFLNTKLAPQVFVPGRIFTGDILIEPPAVFTRNDKPFSWNVGAVYHLFPGVSPYVGASRSNMANFSSESTSNGVQAPESGLQFEAGVKIATPNNKLLLTASAFDVKRNNVFALVGDVPMFNDQKTLGGEGNVQLFLTHRWKILANGTGQHAALTNNPSSPAATGKRPVGVPERMINLWTSFDLPVGVSGFNLAGGLTSRDKMFGDTLNTRSIPAYTALDMVFTYTGRGWNASGGVRNLTDARYFVAANGGGGLVGDARSYFGSLRKTFGAGK